MLILYTRRWFKFAHTNKYFNFRNSKMAKFSRQIATHKEAFKTFQKNGQIFSSNRNTQKSLQFPGKIDPNLLHLALFAKKINYTAPPTGHKMHN